MGLTVTERYGRSARSFRATGRVYPDLVRWRVRASIAHHMPWIALATAVAVLLREPQQWWASVALTAVAAGWSQIGGLCGVAHVNVAIFLHSRGRGPWLRGVSAYTVGGLTTSMIVGAALGLLGSALAVSGTRALLWATCAIGVLLALREKGILRFRLPEHPGRANRTLAYAYGWVLAPLIWGAHIGLGFATVITFGTFWVLSLLVLWSGNVLLGAAVFAAYWAGRALPLWILPASGYTQQLECRKTYPAFVAVNVVALCWLAAVAYSITRTL